MHAYQDKFIFHHFSFCNCINFGGMAVKSENINIALWPEAICFIHVLIMVLPFRFLDRLIS